MNFILIILSLLAFFFLLKIAKHTTSTLVKSACIVTLMLAFASPFFAAIAFFITIVLYSNYN